MHPERYSLRRYTRDPSTMPRTAKNRNGLPSREGSKPRTFEITIDARQRKPCISQLEHDVRAAQQGWQLARELHHVSRIP